MYRKISNHETTNQIIKVISALSDSYIKTSLCLYHDVLKEVQVSVNLKASVGSLSLGRN